MFVLIWATLLFSVRNSNADSGALEGARQHCQLGFCITLIEREITAEAGLCVVIPCSFSTPYYFTHQRLVWSKCEETEPRCSDSNIVFHTNNRKVQSGFTGRVSMLEPDLRQNNCSIIINDLKESDSGSYQLRVNGLQFGRPDGFSFYPRATVSIKGLRQKPTVMVPALTAGQQTTMTCTAPGLCSGSAPKFTWTWRKKGQKDSYVAGNITDFKTENLTAATQRHSSTLTFYPSAEHHGTKVSCEVSFTGDVSTEKTVTLNVTIFPSILSSSACEVQSEVVTCVCISEGFPLPTIKWPLLENRTKYSVTTTVSDNTVHSTVILTVKHHSNTSVECVSNSDIGEAKVNLMIQPKQTEDVVQHHGASTVVPWTIAGVSLSVNVFCIVCILFLCNARKKVKPNQEDKTYMSLRKTGPSAEYDVIAQRRH